MSSLTIEIPVDLQQVIQLHDEIDWKGIALKSLYEYVKKLSVADSLAEKSTLQESDVEILDQTIKKSMNQKYR